MYGAAPVSSEIGGSRLHRVERILICKTRSEPNKRNGADLRPEAVGDAIASDERGLTAESCG